MFERDKDELRELGVPLVTGSDGRPVRGRDRLPDRPRRLRAAGRRLRAATSWPSSAWPRRVWQQASLAGPAARALTKLKRARRRRRTTARSSASSRGCAPPSPRSTPLWAAVRDRVPVALHLPDARARRGRPSGTSSRGASPAGTAAGTSSATTATAARPGSSGSPGSTGAVRRIGQPGAYDVPDDHDAGADGRLTGAPSGRDQGGRAARCAPAAGAGAAPAGRSSVDAPRQPTAGTWSAVGVRATSRRSPTSSSAYGAGRRRGRAGRRCATRSCAGSRPCLGDGRTTPRREPAGMSESRDRAALPAARHGALAAAAPGRRRSPTPRAEFGIDRAPAGQGPRAALRLRHCPGTCPTT